MGARLILSVSMLVVAVSALAQDHPPASPAPSASPPASPSPSVSPRSVRESVDPVVERMEKERTDPCWRAREEGRPCFPVTVIRGPQYSVRESLGILGDKEKPAPGTPPTTAEMREYRPGSQTPIAGFSFDAGCVGKSILKSLKGKNDVYY